MSKYKITGLLRIHNEELILEDTLRYMSNFCSEIFVFDDASDDKSIEITKSFPKVKKVIRNYQWLPTLQDKVQTMQRKFLFDYAKAHSKNDWFLYQDADERIEFMPDIQSIENVSAVRMKLFDSYITPKDKKPYISGDLSKLREWFGPEYREIVILFKRDAKYDLDVSCQREPIVKGKILDIGYVKHYGKSLSIEHWEETCDYYSKYFTKYREKWLKRKGKAIHRKSDFGRRLYTWENVKKHSILMNKPSLFFRFKRKMKQILLREKYFKKNNF